MNPLIRNINYHYAGILKKSYKRAWKNNLFLKETKKYYQGPINGVGPDFWAIVTLLLYDHDMSLLHGWWINVGWERSKLEKVDFYFLVIMEDFQNKPGTTGGH